MKRLFVFLAAIIALVAPAEAKTESSREFVERIYSGYAHEGFSPLRHIDRYFAPPLAREIRKDSAGGEVGYLDGDPLCDCQDFLGVKPRIESVQTTGRDAADARVVLDFGTADVRMVTLHLVLTKSGWRVADVATKEETSLLAALRRSNQKP